MSQNCMTVKVDGLEYQFIAGWDRPTRKLFVSLDPQFDPDALTDEAQIESSDKLFEGAFPLQVADFDDAEDLMNQVKANLNIALPDSFVLALKDDVELDLGNVVREFAPDGNLLSSFSG